RFIGVALEMRERTVVLSVVPASVVLFSIGMAIAIFVVIPIAVKFLMTYSSPELRPLISLSEYLSFVFWMIVGFGLFFQVPLVIVVLARMGVVDPSVLGRYRREAFVIILIVAAFLTPGPDVFSQLALSLPAYLLFEAALFISRRWSKKK